MLVLGRVIENGEVVCSFCDASDFIRKKKNVFFLLGAAYLDFFVHASGGEILGFQKSN